jgi:antibiotic biosynthesis monooxygenase (ABM) superfamily enzyme
MNLGMESPGFLSAEIIPACPPEQADWELLQRFRNADFANGCRNTGARRKLLDEMAAALNTKTDQAVDESISTATRGSVATAIITSVKKGKEAEYRAWEGKMQVRQASYPGYRGSYVQPPSSAAQEQWTTMLRFDTPETLENWFHSEERQDLLNEANEIVASTDFRKMTMSFQGWFPADQKTGKPPAVWKSTLLVVLGLFPIVMLEIKYLNPLLAPLPSAALANLIANVISVAATSYFTIPWAMGTFSWWLQPDEKQESAINLKGILVLAVLFSIELAALWKLL